MGVQEELANHEMERPGKLTEEEGAIPALISLRQGPEVEA
jgi:hypothetical protein